MMLIGLSAHRLEWHGIFLIDFQGSNMVPWSPWCYSKGWGVLSNFCCILSSSIVKAYVPSCLIHSNSILLFAASCFISNSEDLQPAAWLCQGPMALTLRVEDWENCSPSTWLVLDDYAELNLNGKLANLLRSKPPISEAFGQSNAIQLVVPSFAILCMLQQTRQTHVNDPTQWPTHCLQGVYQIRWTFWIPFFFGVSNSNKKKH